MKIAIAGKGGVGKTTISGTLCRILAANGKKVLAIDGDPNPNLSTVLGIKSDEKPAKPLSTDILERVEDANGQYQIIVKSPLEEILSDYGQNGADGLKLLMVGKPELAGSGCMCGSHTTVRELIHTALAHDNEHVVILDMEASMEHMKRGTAKYVDVMYTIIEPYFRSMEAALRFSKMAKELGIKEVYAIANKVRNDQEEQAIRDYCDKHDLDLKYIVPYDEIVKEADLNGNSLFEYAVESKVVKTVSEITAELY